MRLRLLHVLLSEQLTKTLPRAAFRAVYEDFLPSSSNCHATGIKETNENFNLLVYEALS
jgi:hypothetical protein